MKPIKVILGALGITLISCGSALAGGAVLTIQGPGDDDGHFNGAGMVIDCNNDPDLHGIILDHVTNAHVNNYVIKHCEHGVIIKGGGENHLNGLIIKKNSGDGIRLEGRTTNNHINGSTVKKNGEFGINLKSGSDGNKFNTMMVNKNGMGGYNCDNSVKNVITSNKLIGNDYYGVILQSGCDYTTVRGALITNTAGKGIDVGGNNNTIQGNEVTGSNDEGIKLRSNANGNLVQSNIANQNGEQGIENAGDNNTLKSNTTIENGEQGIQVEHNANGNVIKSNTALDNGANDLEDLNPSCDSNNWTSNTFGTTNAACIN